TLAVLDMTKHLLALADHYTRHGPRAVSVAQAIKPN
ncbi:hypothetical protein L915_21360, partial [Phytophthora nicotianae]